MQDIFTLIQSNVRVFEDFRRWLFVKVGNNKQSFINVSKYPNSFKIPYLLEYLETKQVPILEAIIYYNLEHSYHTFLEQASYMIVKEFKRGEENKTINYTPY